MPIELFGKKNHPIILQQIRKLITMKKFEVMAYNDVMRLIKFTDIPWLNARAYSSKHMGRYIADSKYIVREL